MLSKASTRRRARRHGFLKKSDSPGGKNVLKARRQKGRKKLTPNQK
ncbi:50S ribosomal protein L34 [Candidatus Peregrinibacteria bacterium CG22_combo_CG10-13_8_21_14_all_44_10]|nr:MAG: 50S ribosomal protein L34 [Candidatus Peregrinibacteria bacterium CG2_30_44_17]PIP65807.1 MAG: 50S ribosomal protein L34 [Candidatus Peregrinibacteria bacterium CG22_combo_CG10-13_8_21_14_all_44_10]PIS03891.1 MAG: 50S ribosomal protein L34 [Candidatus Peregrinibacteria bacterium CG10_big_fil_rev_8_21_14_0_10_44_7]PIX79333.1 MAG: 50S ribosomal protein L34 [Candidatus Peregrinibacteria bacterium CG_4_10_14_3_um_filter_44_21]PJB88418.1 MAG: 50S ribosomal protein L34 [Candidatus Peregriniba